MKNFAVVLLLFICLSFHLNAQNINGRFSSSIYTFERFDSVNTSDTYIRTFQALNLNVNKNNVSLRTRLNFESDISNTLDNDPRLRFYNLYLEARNLFDVATLKIGRQPLFNFIAGGVYDGANLKVKIGEYSISGYYGGNVPAYQKLELTDSWSDDYIAGGKFTTTALTNFRFAISYVNKNFKAVEYTAKRLDAELNPINILIQRESNQFKYASAEASYSLKNVVRLDTRFDYDFIFSKASKFEINGRYEEIENLGINLYYNYRAPKIRYNSIFAVFNYANTQEIEAGLDYKINDNFTLIGKFGNVIYDDENSQRLSLGVNSNFGSLTYRKTFGYAGELDAVSAYTARSFLDGMLTPSIGVSYTSYKLSEDSKQNNLTTLLGGLNVRPWRTLSFDLQGQFMNNKIYNNDVRLFFKINHWFNSNLNVL